MKAMSHLLATLATIAFLAGPVSAQTQPDAAKNYPNHAIRIIVPFPAGGPTDINMRVIGQYMSEAWGQPVIIDNRPGGNTSIGAEAVARAAPDGYTLLAAMDTTLVMNPATTAKLPYDPFKDFSVITLTAKNTSLLTVLAAHGPKDVKELIAKGKANPGKLNFGAGTITTRLAGYLFAQQAGISIVTVPYKGSAEVVRGLLTGTVDFIVDGTASSLPLIKAGTFRPLAKLNSRPLDALPDVKPLSVAADLPALDDISTWIGLVAPAGTTPAIVNKLHDEVAAIYANPVVAKKLENAGINAVTTTPAEFDSFFRSEAKRWTKVFKDSGIDVN
jgi:tripartite-type tricarboxylate transporter receptor subunit TctC